MSKPYLRDVRDIGFLHSDLIFSSAPSFTTRMKAGSVIEQAVPWLAPNSVVSGKLHAWIPVVLFSSVRVPPLYMSAKPYAHLDQRLFYLFFCFVPIKSPLFIK